jgi:proteic killer suppression protein
MIKSFKCKETAKLFHGRFSSKLPQAIQRSAAIKLEMINAATVFETLRVPPSNHLEELKSERKGQHSIRINKQWRICFTWKGNDTFEVEIVDYH